jgi:hypothetical protein
MEKAKASPGNQYTGKLDRSKNSTGPKTLAGVRVFNAAVGVVVDGNNIHDGANYNVSIYDEIRTREPWELFLSAIPQSDGQAKSTYGLTAFQRPQFRVNLI